MSASPLEVARIALEAFNRREIDAFVELFDERAEIRSVLDRALRGEFTHRGREGARAWITDALDNFDIRVEYRTALRYGSFALLVGTTRGEARSSGAALDQPYGTVTRVVEGRITLFESYFDHAEAIIAFGERLKSEAVVTREQEISGSDLDWSSG